MVNILILIIVIIGMFMNFVEILRGIGSVFVWDVEGYVVINYYVVMNGNKVKIIFLDVSIWEGMVVGVVKNKDFVVLKIVVFVFRLRFIVVGLL